MLYAIGRVLTSWMLHILFRVRYEGYENLPKTGGFMVVSNHRSNMDPVFLAQKVKPRLYFMAKIELFSNWFVGWLLRRLGAFPVKRGQGDTSALEWSEQLIKDGKVLAMFPEGTRSKDGVPLRPKSGAALIAGAVQADVYPCAICFTGKLHFRCRVTVRYGKRIAWEELGMDPQPTPAQIREASRLMMGRIIQLLEEEPCR